MKKLSFLLLLFFAFSHYLSENVSGQKIFPGAVGFGTESRGAYAGSSEPTILYVDTLYAGVYQTSENSGSFEWCVTRDFPRIVLFKVGGVIDYTNVNRRYFYISNPYMNVYGQSAPSPGITLVSMNLYINSNDILFQHMKFRFGDKPMPNGNYMASDCLTVFESGQNVVIDHCSFSWSQDELIGNYGTNTTFSNNLMYEPLVYSVHADEGGAHTPEPHGFGPLVSVRGNFTFTNNFVGWTIARNPHLVANTFVNANNFVFSSALLGPDVSGNNGVVNGCMVGNVNYPTQGQTDSKAEYSVYMRESLPITSQVYLDDNKCIRKDNGFTERENIYTYLDETSLNTILATSSSSTNIDLSEYNILSSEDVEDYIVNNAGARFWDRDHYDALAIAKMRNREQDFISSPEPLPARAYNRGRTEGWRTNNGQMEFGYDFSANPVTFTVNGQTISLTSNLTSQSAVLNAINSQMPNGTVAVDHPHPLSTHIILQTEAVGSENSITVEGDDLIVFGIYPGTYYGEDGVGGYPDFAPTYTELSVPSNPHNDDNSNGYTNIEEWVFGLANVDDTCKNLSVAATVTHDINGQGIGALDVNVVGGNEPFNFVWEDNADIQTEDRDNLSANTYSLTVTDAIGCERINNWTIENHVDSVDDTTNTGGGGGSSSPVIVVDDNVQAEGGVQKQIDASASYDSDTDSQNLTFNWIAPSGVSISQNNTPIISLLAKDVAVSTIKDLVLEVSDGETTERKTIELEVVPYKPEVEEIRVLSIASSGYVGVNYPENVLDGNEFSFWAENGEGSWLTLELERFVDASHLKLAYFNSEDRKSIFDIYASSDGQEWESISERFESCGYSNSNHVVDFPETKSARDYKFVKFVGHGNTEDNYNIIAEVKVFGSPLNPSNTDAIANADIVEVYPNPASQFFNISLKKDADVQVMNLNGKVFHEQHLFSGLNEMDLTLPQGIYLIKILSENTITTKRLIIK